jgi:hypothetical protein
MKITAASFIRLIKSHFCAGAFALSFGLFCLLVGPHAASAQMTSDRPSFGTTAHLLPTGRLQAETGYQWGHTESTLTLIGIPTPPSTGVRQTDIDVTSHEAGPLLLRYGLASRLEVRAELGGVTFREVREHATVDRSEEGYSGLNLGAKIGLYDGTATRLSLVTMTDVRATRTGALETGDDRARQRVRLALEQAVGGPVTASMNAGVQFFFAEDRFGSRTPVYVVTPALHAPVTDQLGAFLGYAGFFQDGPNRSFVEGGVTVDIGGSTQLDINGGLRVDGNVDREYFFGVGVAQRL